MRPILSNIYLNELDIFIESLSTEFYKGTHRATNREYATLRAEYNKWKGRDTDLASAYLYLSNSIPAKDPIDKNYRRLHYVRYADDFILGVIGSAYDARQIKEQVNNFLATHLLLKVSPEKHVLARARKERVKFLGVEVRVPIYKESPLKTYTRTRYGQPQLVKARVAQGTVKLKVNIKAVITKLNSAGFCNKLGVPTPRFQLYAMNHNEIILMYNRVFRGIKNYFSFTDNFSTLAHAIQHILIRSCAKLLAAKLKMKTTKAVYRKFGKDLNHDGPKFA